MSTVHSSIIAAPPTLLIQPVVKDKEQAKYEKAWSIPAYREYAPGEHAANTFLSLARPTPGETVIDFGAGTGRGAMMIALIGRVNVHMLDFAGNCLDPEVRQSLTTQNGVLKFTKHDLRKPSPVFAKYGFCTDVMEHIEPEEVDRVLHHILKSAQNVYFQISTVPDHFGKEVGEDLHLTVKPYEWWRDKFAQYDATIMWSKESHGMCGFYVSAWQSAQELIRNGTLNNDVTVIQDNIRSSTARGLLEAQPYQKVDTTVVILAGGPSMNQFEGEIAQRRGDGDKLITVNGAYNWAMSRGIVPSAQVVVDSREFNKRFVEPYDERVRYLLASQCHPATFDAVSRDQTLLWHSAVDEDMLKYLSNHYEGTGRPWYPVLGGSTVMLRTLPLMVLLGYHRFEVYGWDSCLMDGKHHGYEQVENDGQLVLQVVVNNRTFHCHPWMVSQAQEFLDLMQLMSEHIDLVVHGDGLISWLVKTASELDEVKIDVVQ